MSYRKTIFTTIVFLMFGLMAVNVAMSLRSTRPPMQKFPLEEDQVSQLNRFHEEIWNMQGGRFEFDIPSSSKTGANNGEMWFLEDGIDSQIQIMVGDEVRTFNNNEGMMLQGHTWHAYGGFQEVAETITTGTQNVWYHITNVGNDLWTGLEADGLTLSADVMTFVNSGDYSGSLSLTFSGSNGKDYEIRLYNITQTTQMGYLIGTTTTGNTNFTNITLPLYIEATAGDEMRMEIRCITVATANPIVRSSVFYLNYLHD